jgi:xanthine dehydrogenase accessory factor
VALVTRDGGFHGWIGGSCTSPVVAAEAIGAIAAGAPRLVVLEPEPRSAARAGVVVHPMTCHSGGSVEIHIQPVVPAPRLVVFGVSPTARALARLGKAMGWAVHGVDPAADAAAFPGADGVWTEPGALRLERGAAPIWAVVATQGEWDEEALAAAFALSPDSLPDYVGVVASKKRFAEVRERLGSRLGEAAWARVRSPAGVFLGGPRPEEIAVSIVAEIVAARASTAAPAEQPGDVPVAATVDLVCGMTVEVGKARHTAEHAGRTYYFCCGGCRERFLAEPERYLPASPGGAP